MEVQDQGAGRFGFPQDLSPWLTDGHLLAVSSHGLSSVCVESSVLISYSYKDTGQIG